MIVDDDTHPILALLESPETDDGAILKARSFGEEGCNILLDVVRNPDAGLTPVQRGRAVHLLGELTCEEFAGQPEAFLDDQDGPVRLSAIYALMGTDAKITAPLLRARLDEDTHDAIFKAHALRALVAYGTEAEILALSDWAEAQDAVELRIVMEEILDALPAGSLSRGSGPGGQSDPQD